jgi:predicted negative regulator of RcsB-dependent stress response
MSIEDGSGAVTVPGTNFTSVGRSVKLSVKKVNDDGKPATLLNVKAAERGTLALALLDLGATAGARTQIEQATDLAQQANHRNLKLMTAIAKARIDSASGKNEDAMKGLASVEREAHAAGLVAIEFEARLALGEV